MTLSMGFPIINGYLPYITFNKELLTLAQQLGITNKIFNLPYHFINKLICYNMKKICYNFLVDYLYFKNTIRTALYKIMGHYNGGKKLRNDKTSNYGIPFLYSIIFCTIGLFTIGYGLIVGVIVGLLLAILIALERILNILNKEYKSKN